MNDSLTTRWWWIRHAPVTVNNGRIYGQSDPPADVDDLPMFRGLARILPKDGVLVTSHLQRTHQTAEAIRAGGLPLPEALVERDLAEQHLGEWQGRPREEVFAEVGHSFWLAPARHQPPNGESFADMTGRVAAVIDRLTETLSGRDIIAVTHGGTIRAALAHALCLDPEYALSFHIDNCSVTRIEYRGRTESHPNGAWAIMRVNECAARC